MTPSTFYTLTPPTARFCPNRAFCVAGAPDFKPTSSTGRGDADVGAESESRVEELGGVREERFSLESNDMRLIKSPKATPLPPSPSYVGVGALGAPLHQPI